MFSTCKQFIKVNEDLYLIKKVYEESKVKNVDFVKEWLETESVFRKEGNLYFCTKIEELELIVEEDQLVTT